MLSDNPFIEKNYPWTYKESDGGFFLPEVYDKLVDILYSDTIKDWNVVNDDGTDDAYPQGQVVIIDDEEREKASGFLREFYDWLWTDELEAKIFEVTGINFKNYTRLWHLDYPEFDQAWHNDVEPFYTDIELTTFQIYMAKDESKKHSGVILADKIDPEDDEDYSLGVAQVEYKPNHAWAFTANLNTWHAVKPIDFYRPSFIARNFNQ